MLPSKQEGFTLIEVMISLGILAVISTAGFVRFNSIQKSLQDTSRLMAFDALEAGLAGFMRDRFTIEYSVAQSSNAELKACFNSGICSHGRSYDLDLYVQGQKQPITGPQVYYDESGVIGKATPRSVRILTSVRTFCANTPSCQGPDYVTVIAQIRHNKEKTPLRSFAFDMEKFKNKTFPGLDLSCPDSSGMLRGIGLHGEAICTNKNQVVLVGSDNLALPSSMQITPTDCSLLDVLPTDQTFVSGYDKTGKILCTKRFW